FKPPLALKNRASSPSEPSSEQGRLLLAEATNFRVPDGFGRFLSLKRGMLRCLVAFFR
ncbi:hypothetical protein A2U01_0084237, partial [Trifolium medium]|nr:hypothetical protein [Trifolium medium]